jgi:PAS domain S-box-containing protein
LFNFLSNFTLEPKERIYAIHKIKFILWVIKIFMVVFLLLNPADYFRWAISILVVFIVQIASSIALKKDFVSLSVLLIVVPTWLLVTLLTVTGMGLYSNAAIFYALPIISIGLLFNLSLGFLFSILSIFVLLTIYVLNISGILYSLNIEKNLDSRLLTLILFIISIQTLLVMFTKIIKNAIEGKSKENEDRRRAERVVREVNQYLQNVLESASRVSIISTDTSGIIMTFNKGAENLLGYSRSEMIGRETPMKFHSPKQIQNRKIEIEDLTGSEVSEFDALVYYARRGILDEREWDHYLKDGTKKIVNLSISAIYNDLGEISGYLGTAIDITESIQSRSIIEALNLELEKKVEIRTKELQEVNRNLLEMNYEMERTLKELSETQSQLIQSEKLAAIGQLTAGIGHELNTPLGTIISASHTLQELLSDDLFTSIGLISNLSSKDFESFSLLLDMGQKNATMNSNYLSRKERVEEKSKIIKLFNNLDNEQIEILQEFNLYNNEEIVSLIKSLENRDIVFGLLNVFLHIYKMNLLISLAGEKSFHVVRSLKLYLNSESDSSSEEIYLSKEIDIILILNQNRLKYGIEVSKEFYAPEPFKGKRGLLNQIWINLINNSIHAMNGKGHLGIKTWVESPHVVVSISDTGVGVPESLENQIFEPFFTTKKAGDGIGLGLHICRKIIESMGGHISFTSEPGKTEFVVKIPIP